MSARPLPPLRLQADGLCTFIALAADVVGGCELKPHEIILLRNASNAALQRFGETAEAVAATLFNQVDVQPPAPDTLLMAARIMQELSAIGEALSREEARHRREVKGGVIVKRDAMKGGV